MRVERETEWARRQRRDRLRATYIERNGDRCELCGAERGTPGLCKAVPMRPWDEDHDHATGEHRGFICARANKWLPAWMTAEWLRAAADYLDRAVPGD